MTTTIAATSAVEAAQHALDLVGEDPHRALEEARAVLAGLPRPRTGVEVRAVVTARRAEGRALRNLGRTTEALAQVRRGVSAAERQGFPELAAEGRMTLSFLLLEVGRLRAALATIDQALGSLDGLEAAKARTNRALILHRAGRPREAMEEYAAALPVIRRAGDRLSESIVRGNRAQLYAEQGDTASAVKDLEWARDFDIELGRTVDAADDLWNLAAVHAIAGDIPRALDLFDRADLEWGDVDRPQRFTSRAEVLLSAGLVDEAAELSAVGVRWAPPPRGGDAPGEARLWLALASLSLSTPDLATAAREARAAVVAFTAQGRPDWQVLAQHVELVVRLRGPVRSADLDRAIEVASLLRDRGREAHAADLRVTAGRAAFLSGDRARGRTLLGPLANQTASRQLEVRARAWYARALLQIDERAAGAGASLRKAWQLNEEQTSLRGATELRAAAASHGSDIVQSGVALAVTGSVARAAFDWAERGRSTGLRRPNVRAPGDPELAAALARLRWSALQDESALLEGDPDPAARSRRRRDEAAVLRLTRRQQGSGPARRPVDLGEVQRHLAADDVLAAYLQHEGSLWAVRVTATRAALVRVGATAEVADQVDTVLFGLGRLLAAAPRPRSQASLRASVADAARRLHQTVIAPLAGPDPARLVVCPDGPLCSLPWSALALAVPAAAPTVAPSATTWVGAVGRPRTEAPRVLAVAGPGLPGAAAEVREVAARHPGAVALLGAEATADRVADEMAAAGLVHLAAHGRLRRDNPLFSTLLLDDGPLTAYDLEALPSAPSELVLSACSSGAGHAVVGNELLGLSWTLLAGGARTVLAPVLPVPDEGTTQVMIALHEHLARGAGLPAAWRATQAQLLDDEELRLVCAAFTLYGA